jgi:predicted outer membrane repeat protein
MVLNSSFVSNRAIGIGANPAARGTPGGGSGAAIYNDGNQMTLSIGGSLFTDNHANEGGGAIFFVSNDRTGTMAIGHSTLERNRNDRFQTPACPASISSAPVAPRSPIRSCADRSAESGGVDRTVKDPDPARADGARVRAAPCRRAADLG